MENIIKNLTKKTIKYFTDLKKTKGEHIDLDEAKGLLQALETEQEINIKKGWINISPNGENRKTNLGTNSINNAMIILDSFESQGLEFNEGTHNIFYRFGKENHRVYASFINQGNIIYYANFSYKIPEKVPEKLPA